MPLSAAGVVDFVRTFSGNKKAYGVHIYKKLNVKGQKEEGENYTKTEELLDDYYTKHLEGKQGLGVIPIREDNKVLFSVIDIDEYENNVLRVVDMIYKGAMPIVPFRSKSGGLHAYIFYKEPIIAQSAINYTKQFVQLLGLTDQTEIFPKQARLREEQVGNWINLPYYNAENTKQYLISQNHEALTLYEAMDYVKECKQSEENIKSYLETLPLADGPPCLQSIYNSGHTEYRNEYLFSLARYFKTKFGDDFEHKIVEANAQLDKPLPVSEVQRTIIATHKKKDYTYRCNAEPCVSLCNKTVCQSRKYGIGGDTVSNLSYEEFIQYVTDPPYYEWIVNGKSLKFYNELDIINQQAFRQLCFRELHILPGRLKDINWTNIINNALQNVIIRTVDAAEDVSPGSMFKEFLVEFLEKRAQAPIPEHIELDKVYKDEEKQSYIFKPKNLINFLFYQKQFRYYGQTEIQDRLRRLGGRPERYYINGSRKTVRCWSLPYKALLKFVEDEETEKFEVDFTGDENGQADF